MNNQYSVMYTLYRSDINVYYYVCINDLYDDTYIIESDNRTFFTINIPENKNDDIITVINEIVPENKEKNRYYSLLSISKKFYDLCHNELDQRYNNNELSIYEISLYYECRKNDKRKWRF